MFPRMESSGGGNSHNEFCPTTIRINVPLNTEHPEENVFDYQELLQQAIGASGGGGASSSGPSGPSRMETTSDGSDNEDSTDSSPEVSTRTTQRRKGPEDYYDLEDDFIDDSDMFFAEVGHFAPAKWDFGFFAWRGPVENFLEEQGPNPFEREAPATASKAKGKKKATTGSAEKKAANGNTERKGKTTTKKGKKTASAATSVPVSPKEDGLAATALEDAETALTTKASVTVAVSSSSTRDAVMESFENGDSADLWVIDKSPAPSDDDMSDDDVPLSNKHSRFVNKGKSADEAQTKQDSPIATAEISNGLSTPAQGKPASSETAKKKSKKSKAAPVDEDTTSVLQAIGSENDKLVKKKGKDKEKKKKEKVEEKERARSSSLAPGLTHKVKKPKSKLTRKVETLIEQLEESARELGLKPDDNPVPIATFPKEFILRLQTAAHKAFQLSCLTPTFYDRISKFLPVTAADLQKNIDIYIIPKKLERLKPDVKNMYSAFETKIQEILLNSNVAMPSTGESPNGSGEASVKFEWTEDLKHLFWNLLCSEWEMALLDNEYRELLGTRPNFNENGVRKAVYAKVMSYWPEGMMNGDILSRTYSHMKRKLERFVETGRDAGPLKPDPFRTEKRKRKSAPPALEGGPLDDSPVPAKKKSKKKPKLSLDQTTQSEDTPVVTDTPISTVPPSPAHVSNKEATRSSAPPSLDPAAASVTADTGKRPLVHDENDNPEKQKKKRKSVSPTDNLVSLDTLSAPSASTKPQANDIPALHIPGSSHTKTTPQAQAHVVIPVSDLHQQVADTVRKAEENSRANVMSVSEMVQ